MNSKVVYSFHTEKGVRDENQDSLLIMEDVLLFAVADGMGGG
jgi:serine/threonine protein phosphatase PrpC